MNIINITLGVDTQPCSSITLGRRGENEVTQVVVDFSSWVEEFGAGVITLLAMRSQDTSAYPVVLTLSSNTATWDVTSTDTAYKGSGRAEFIYTVGEQIAKSVVFNTVVMQDIGEPSETPPDPYEDWLERLTELGAETQANAEAAQQSAEDAEQSAQEAAQEAANAEGYAEQAGEYASAAQSAEAASESARDEAQTAQASAEASATAASGSAASAAGSATAAAGSATDASASATAAGVSAATAGTAATQAEAAKTAAQAAQSAAEDAAEDAQQAAQQAHVEYEQLSGEVDDLSDEVSQQKSAIEDLQDLTNRKAGALIDTASGSIASFVPDATIDNLLGVSVDIEPVQDLHGFDAPWPAGGGVNKFSGQWPPDVSGTYVGWYSGATTSCAIKIFDKANGADISKIYFGVGVNGTDTPVVWLISNGVIERTLITSSTSGTFYPYVTMYPNNRETLEKVLNRFDVLVAIDGADYSTYSPYENLCPISGWDSVEVEADGINIWDEEWEVGAISGSGVPTAATNAIRAKNFCPCKGDTTYYMSCGKTDGGNNNKYYLGIFFYDKDKRFLRTIFNNNGTVQAPSDARFFKICTNTSAVIYGNTYNNDIRINYPATDHAYHPFAGNTYTIALGQTVYGGTLDATNGTLTVDRVKYSLKDVADISQYIQTSDGYAYVLRPDLTNIPENIPPTKVMSSVYLPVNPNTINAASTAGLIGVYVVGTNRFIIVTSKATTVADFKAELVAYNAEIVLPLATPITIQLDPVTISTISGQTNNVWADAGDVSVTYAADIKAYIDRMNQPTEDDMIANSLIAANKYFTVNNKLYLSTASIAAGAQIIPGTNCTETSLVEALNALNA